MLKALTEKVRWREAATDYDSFSAFGADQVPEIRTKMKELFTTNFDPVVAKVFTSSLGDDKFEFSTDEEVLIPATVEHFVEEINRVHPDYIKSKLNRVDFANGLISFVFEDLPERNENTKQHEIFDEKLTERLIPESTYRFVDGIKDVLSSFNEGF